MKKKLYIYIAIILMYIAYNQFFMIEDEKVNTLVNILFASLLFGYMAYMAIVLLKRLKK